MKRILCLILALTPAAAHADKNFKSGKGTTWDCKKDPKVNISHGKGVYTFKGACTEINLTGGKSKLTIESVDQLNINSGENTITVGTLGSLNLVGSKNKVTYKQAKDGATAQVSTLGTDNLVQKADGTVTAKTTDNSATASATNGGNGGNGANGANGAHGVDVNAVAGVDVNALTRNAVTATAGGSGGTIDCAKTPTFADNDNDGEFVLKGKCDKIVLNGNNIKVKAESAKSVSVDGNNNHVEVITVDAISTNGNNNSVTYKKALTASAKVKVSNPGNGNTIKLMK